MNRRAFFATLAAAVRGSRSGSGWFHDGAGTYFYAFDRPLVKVFVEGATVRQALDRYGRCPR